MTKTILIITDNVPDQVNGVVTTFKNLEDHADRNGYHVVYINPRQFPNFACPGYPEVRLCWPHGISKKIKAIHPDFIHIATEGPVGFFARWWCERNKIPYNTSYHTKFPEFLNKLYGVPVAWTYWYMRWFHCHSERVLVTTESMRKDLDGRGFKNLVVWTRGADRTIQPQVTRSSYRTRPRLLSVGRVSKEKGLDDLIQFQEDYDLIIVGDGPYRDELERKLPQATFLGYLHGQELVNQYALADVFVFPYVTDTFGVVIIEALAQGCPVAAYPVAGPVDIIKNGVTGYLDNNLAQSVRNCLALNNDRIKKASQKWTWVECWRIFKKNLVSVA